MGWTVHHTHIRLQTPYTDEPIPHTHSLTNTHVNETLDFQPHQLAYAALQLERLRVYRLHNYNNRHPNQHSALHATLYATDSLHLHPTPCIRHPTPYSDVWTVAPATNHDQPNHRLASVATCRYTSPCTDHTGIRIRIHVC